MLKRDHIKVMFSPKTRTYQFEAYVYLSTYLQLHKKQKLIEIQQ